DNAEERLVPCARAIGLVGDEAVERLEIARAARQRTRTLLGRLRSARYGHKTLLEALTRPEVTLAGLAAEHPELAALELDPGLLEAVEVEVKYAGYIERAEEQVERLRREETVEIPGDLDYGALSGLANEAKDQLAKLRPRTLGAASRLAGVRPPDV